MPEHLNIGIAGSATNMRIYNIYGTFDLQMDVKPERYAAEKKTDKDKPLAFVGWAAGYIQKNI